MANNYKVHSYSHLIVKDLDKAYFLPYRRSSYCKGSRLYDDNKYMYFDYAKKDTKESDLMRPIRHLATIGDAIASLVPSNQITGKSGCQFVQRSRKSKICGRWLRRRHPSRDHWTTAVFCQP